MKSFLDTIQLSAQYLNSEDDPVSSIGKSINPDSLPGTAYAGLLGKVIEIDHAQAAKLSNSTNTLYAGLYQLVLFKSGSSASNARGQLVFWDTLANSGYTGYVVTPDVTSTNITQVAGVTLNAVTKGQYGWIQIMGMASVKSAGAVTSTAIGNIAFVDVSPTNTFDANTEAAVTIRQFSKKIGITYETASAGTVTKVWLQGGGAVVWNW